MRVFQPVDPEDLEEGPYKFVGQKIIITSTDGKKVNITAASWGGVGYLWDKRLVFIFVRKKRYTRELLDTTGEFSVSFVDQQEFRGALKYLSLVSGRDEDKVAGARMNIGYYEGIPYVEEAGEVLVCRTVFKQELEKGGFVEEGLAEKFYKSDEDCHILYAGELSKILLR